MFVMKLIDYITGLIKVSIKDFETKKGIVYTYAFVFSLDHNSDETLIFEAS